jgi:hypothetical protein
MSEAKKRMESIASPSVFFGRYDDLEDVPLENVFASMDDECLIFTKNQDWSAWYWHSIPVEASLIPIPVL